MLFKIVVRAQRLKTLWKSVADKFGIEQNAAAPQQIAQTKECLC